MHHIALLVRDVELVSSFYCEVLGAREVMRHFTEKGDLRSVWVAMNRVVVMVERSSAPDDLDFAEEFPEEMSVARRASMARLGWSVVAFSSGALSLEAWEERLRERGVELAYRTDWTLYFQDPENTAEAPSLSKGPRV